MDVEKKRGLPFDILLLTAAFAVVFIALSVYSHSSDDPSYSHIIFSQYNVQYHNLFGKIGAYTADFIGSFFGWCSLLLPVLAASVPYKLWQIRGGRETRLFSPVVSFLAALFFLFLLSVLTGFFGGNDVYFEDKPSGGVIGLISADFLTSLLGSLGGVLITVFLLLISFMLFFAVTLTDIKHLILKIKPEIKRREKEPAPAEANEASAEPEEARQEIVEEIDLEQFHTLEEPKPVDEPVLKTPAEESAEAVFETPETQEGIDIKPKETVEQTSVKYTVPLDLLDKPKEKVAGESDEDLKKKALILEQKLKDFGVMGKVREIRPGPVVTLFEFEPAPGIKINKIAGLSDDLALAMSALSVRIIAPIPGKSVVGIELPNEVRESVSLSELLTSLRFAESTSPLTFAMGKDASGKPYISDLSKMPHLLIAGTTGSGKSVAVNTMICSVLYKSSPDAVKFVMVDPKMVELSVYEGIPHLAAPVVVDVRKAAAVLKNVVQEMESRYSLLAEFKVRNIDSYNQKIEEDSERQKMPYLIVVVDEFADLMMVAGKDVEQSIIRIAQMARAVGIHLILATQRPSVNVITGIIKANMPARLSFKVSSKIDSRTIIDSNGAELLLGRGDSLFMPPGTSDTVRVHGCFVSDEEVGRVTDYIRTLGEPEYNMDLIKEDDADAAEIDDSDIDDKYYEALELVRQKGFASISMIQRYLRIGYNRAARIVEIMEQKGIIAPSDGTSKPREVIKKD
jgi:S-DNA-T family DNA segregation ATPase FtsK/SpoIIIE